MRVLDVVCGSGEPSISMAVRLKGTGGVTGNVIGVDMAVAPLQVARQRARARGLDNVEYVQGDVHALPFADGSFDRVTSRLGVMFFADLAKALAEMHRVLTPGLATGTQRDALLRPQALAGTGQPTALRSPTPGGRVALLAWGPMEQPYFDATIGTVRRLRPELEVPEAARAMFRFGKAGTLSRALAEAGFGTVEEQLLGLRWDWHGPPEEMWDYFRGVTVPFRALLEKVDGDAAVDRAVLAALGESFDGEWVRCEAQMVMATAVRGL